MGVLALQGAFADHQAALAACGLRTRQIRTASALRGIDALVLPGGESTTMLKLLESEGLWGPLGEALLDRKRDRGTHQYSRPSSVDGTR